MGDITTLQGIKSSITKKAKDANKIYLEVREFYQPPLNDDAKALLRANLPKLLEKITVLDGLKKEYEKHLGEHKALSSTPDVFKANKKEMEKHLMETNHYEEYRENILQLIEKIQEFDGIPAEQRHARRLRAPADNTLIPSSSNAALAAQAVAAPPVAPAPLAVDAPAVAPAAPTTTANNATKRTQVVSSYNTRSSSAAPQDRRKSIEILQGNTSNNGSMDPSIQYQQEIAQRINEIEGKYQRIDQMMVNFQQEHMDYTRANTESLRTAVYQVMDKLEGIQLPTVNQSTTNTTGMQGQNQDSSNGNDNSNRRLTHGQVLGYQHRPQYSNDGRNNYQRFEQEQSPEMSPVVANEILAIKEVVKKFAGEAHEYPLFITNFRKMVHENPRISTHLKQGILLSLLEGQAAEDLRSAQMSEEAYEALLLNMERQYNNNSLQKDTMLDKLKVIKFDDRDYQQMERTLNTYCNTAQHLKCLGIEINDDHFRSAFVDKMPECIRSQVYRRYTKGEKTFAHVSNAAYEAIREKKNDERLRKRLDQPHSDEIFVNTVQHQKNYQRTSYQQSSGNRGQNKPAWGRRNRRNFVPPSRDTPCSYCASQEHSACECTIPVSKKIEAVNKKKLCNNCLSDKHMIRECNSRYRCFHCHMRHYSGHCDKVEAVNVNTFRQFVDLYDDEPLEEHNNSSHSILPALPNSTSTSFSTSECSQPVKSSKGTTPHRPNSASMKIGESFAPVDQAEESLDRILQESRLDNMPDEPEAETLQIVVHHLKDKEAKLPFVQLITPSGDKLIALVDSGAESSIISTTAATKLNLPAIGRRRIKFTGFVSESPPDWSTYYRLVVTDLHGNEWAMRLPSYGDMNTIFKSPEHTSDDIQYLEGHQMNIDRITKLQSYDDKPIDLLLGNNVLNKIKKLEKITTYDLPSGKTVEKMLIGYVNYPPVNEEAFVPAIDEVNIQVVGDLEEIHIHTLETEDYQLELKEHHVHNAISNAKLHKLVEQNSSLEVVGIENPTIVKSREDHDNELIERQKSETTWDADGIASTKFPLNGREKYLRGNFPLARKRLTGLYNNKLKSKKLRDDYHQKIQEQLQSGIIEEVTSDMTNDGGPHFYMPSSVVFKEDSATTKMRIVQDASAHMKGELSINDCMHPGPALLNAILGILLRARLGLYLMISDIEKAFHQVRIQKEHRNMLKILWLRDPELGPVDGNIVTYRFTRLPFGVTSSPFLLAVIILMYLDKHPAEINKKITENIYVDNILFVTNNKEDLIGYYEESNAAYQRMRMNLREFLTNDPETMARIPAEDRAATSVVKLLGHIWDSEKDTITIKVPAPPEGIPTKRELLQFCASIYDPCGNIAPLLVDTKGLIADVWDKGLGWDKEITADLVPKWEAIKKKFTSTSFVIPRQLVTNYDFNRVELVLFADASKSHYGIAAYLRYGYKEGHFVTKLILAKSRIKPHKGGKEHTIPRMELTAQELASNTAVMLLKELHMDIKRVTFFSDSICTIFWTTSRVTNSVGSVWVANRVKAFHENLDTIRNKYNCEATIRYVPTDVNPADIATRGCSMQELQDNKIWNEGPEFLIKSEEHWPSKLDGTAADPHAFREEAIQKGLIEEETSDQKAERIRINAISTSSSYESVIPYHRSNSFMTLTSRVSKAMQWIHHIVDKRNRRYPTKKIEFKGHAMKSFDEATWNNDEIAKLNIAKEVILADHYKDSEAKKISDVPAQFHSASCENGIWKYQSRLDKATDSRITEEMKRPIIIMHKHRLAKLIASDSHINLKHQGIQDMMEDVQRRYTIKGLSTIVKEVRRRCFKCQMRHARPYAYPYSRILPAVRTTLEGPFKHIGLDYLGPLSYHIGPNTEGKFWVLLITCLVTRAIHLECVTSNHTTGFVNAFRRFTSRRGIPKSILSDNAT
ncbi:hypothetical protein CRE_26836, partial [Caenorhabditis remanei]